jgi:type II secretory pathway component PulF
MPQGRLAWDAFKLKLPLVGPIVMKTQVSRLMRTLSLLIAGAMPITSSLEIAKFVLNNTIVASAVQGLKDKISGGARLSESLKSSGFFNDFVINIVAIGEETGALDKVLLTIANDYEKDVDRALALFARLLEPVLILIMGMIVGFIVLSMLLPIFQINLIVS